MTLLGKGQEPSLRKCFYFKKMKSLAFLLHFEYNEIAVF